MDQETVWTKLLASVLTNKGKLSAAYSMFWNYSLGNMVMIMCQCLERGLPLGPVATYKRWQELGRQVVRKPLGEGMFMFMPVTAKAKYTERGTDGKDTEKTRTWTRFILRKLWFTLSQTEGTATIEQAPQPPTWDRQTAMSSLNIVEVPFAELNGNVQGYAKRHEDAGKPFELAINPVAVSPMKTLLHEMAHIVLGHVEKTAIADTQDMTRGLREVEAESVAMIVGDTLGLLDSETIECSRAYIWHWGAPNGADLRIPEDAARRIFAASDKIIKAGTGMERKPKAASVSA